MRTATILLCAGSGRWTTRRVSLATMHRHTSMQDMLQSLRECIKTFYPQTFDGGGHKCNHFVSANILSLYPTLNNKANNTVVLDYGDVNVITSNCSPHQHINKTEVREQSLIAATARATISNPIPQYLNVLTIAANKANADTGATTVF